MVSVWERIPASPRSQRPLNIRKETHIFVDFAGQNNSGLVGLLICRLADTMKRGRTSKLRERM